MVQLCKKCMSITSEGCKMFNFLKKEGKGENEAGVGGNEVIKNDEKEDIKNAIEGKNSLEVSTSLSTHDANLQDKREERYMKDKNIEKEGQEMSKSLPLPSQSNIPQPPALSQSSSHPSNPVPQEMSRDISEKLLSPSKGEEREGGSIEDKINKEIKDLDSFFSPPSPTHSSPSVPALDAKEGKKDKKEEISSSPNIYPLFISMKKYTEMINEINTIKISLKTMEEVTRELNKIREEDNKVLDTTLNELEEINSRIKQISQSFKV